MWTSEFNDIRKFLFAYGFVFNYKIKRRILYVIIIINNNSKLFLLVYNIYYNNFTNGLMLIHNVNNF